MRYGQSKYGQKQEKPVVRDKRTFSREAFADILKQDTDKAQQTINQLNGKEENKDE